MHRGTPVRAGHQNVGAHTVAVRSAGTFLRQTEADCSPVDRAPRLIGDFDGQGTAGACSCGVDGALPFEDADVQQGCCIEGKGEEDEAREGP